MVATARRMNALGLNQGMSGNLSLRLPGKRGLLVTPSSVAYDAMGPADVVQMAWSGAWTGAEGRRPSSEWRFHRDILRARPEFGAVLHAHPVHATALACHGRGIGPFHYMIAIAGGRDIRCAPYAIFGSQELSDHALTALEGRKACLLAHHGLIACGRDLAQALDVAVEVETLAAQYLAACALGAPPDLPDAEIDAVLDKIAQGPGYGSA
ncbi:MAG: class II aldolase/adducin family protein, partial [Pseudomonadota bacterium]